MIRGLRVFVVLSCLAVLGCNGALPGSSSPQSSSAVAPSTSSALPAPRGPAVSPVASATPPIVKGGSTGPTTSGSTGGGSTGGGSTGGGGGGGRGLTPKTRPLSPFLYTAELANGQVQELAIAPGSGLPALSGAAVPTPQGPAMIVLHPSGKFAWVGDQPAGEITSFTVDPATGQLGNPTTIALGAPGQTSIVAALAVHPLGGFLYATDSNQAKLHAFAIDATTGHLTELAGSPYAVTVTSPLAIDPSGALLVLAGQGGAVAPAPIVTFSIDARGGLTALPVTTTAATGVPSLCIEPTGRFAYISNPAGTSPVIARFKVDPKQGLVPAALYNFTVVPLAIQATGLLLAHPGGKWLYGLYMTSYPQQFVQFTIDATTGEPVNPVITPFPQGSPTSATFDASGAFLYVVSSQANAIVTYSVDPATGALTEKGTTSVPSFTWSIAATP